MSNSEGHKSTVEEIRKRFDADVERFSRLEEGQSATIDSPICLELVSEAAARVTPHARHVLDVGCGAGNYTLKLLQRLPHLDATLLDLSHPMLDRARERVSAATTGTVQTIQDDIRNVELEAESIDIILATAVLHHLRGDEEWDAVFAKFHAALRPGGGLWIFDLITHSFAPVHEMMWRRYGEYLTGLQGEAYRDTVFGYIEQEDTPRPLMWQLDRVRAAGFQQLDVLHKNSCFAAFGAVKV